MRWWPLLFVCLGACDPEGTHRVVVDLQTDLLPGVEFVQAQAILVDPATRQSVTVGSADDFLEAARVAVFDDVPAGRRLFRVDLLDAGGARVATGRTQVELRERRAVRVRIFRSCLGVDCPEDETCAGGECVPATCNDELSEDQCEETECEVDADCPDPGASCGSAVCDNGACLLPGDDAVCMDSEVCNPDEGCVPAVPNDAGPPRLVDGGDLALDAGAPDAGAPDPFACAKPVDGSTIAVYPMEDADMGLLSDVTRAHDGSFPVLRPDLTAGPSSCGRAMRIATDTSYGVVPDSPAFAHREGALELRMLLTSDAVRGAVLTRDAAGQTQGQFSLFLDDAGRLVARFQSGGRSIAACSDAPLPAGRWYYVGVNYGAAGAELFVNGVSQRGAATWRTEGESGPCGDTSPVGMIGESNPWIFGASSTRAVPGTGEPLGPATVGLVLDHVRFSSMRRDFSRFAP